MVVDHYGLDASWESEVRRRGIKVLAIDDLADRPHQADLLLDQNDVIADSGRYAALVPESTVQLLGPQYALLRPDFRNARAARAVQAGKHGVPRVLVFFGGADSKRWTARCVEILLQGCPRDWVLDIVVGSGNPDRHFLEGLAGETESVFTHIDVSQMACLMASADLYVGSGGTVTWERLCVGLPGVVMSIADNQERIAADLAARNLQIYLGSARSVEPAAILESARRLLADSSLRKKMVSRGRSLVDGRGASRVYRQMQRLVSS
jgi:UDP-2,4-diacetamido-2,4,6-trideoxy-beta-L-altropyranose hydrolase